MEATVNSMKRYSAWMIVLLLVVLVAIAVRNPVVERRDGATDTARALDPETATRRLLQALTGPIAEDAETAIALAETLIRQRFGEETVKTQWPLSAHDAGEFWAITGPPDAVQPTSGVGPVRIEVRKADAGISALYFDAAAAARAQMEEIRERLRQRQAP